MSDEILKARRYAVELLARREHTCLELTRKLSARGIGEGIIHQVLKALATEGLQSDARCAESYVRERTQKGYGPLRIREALRMRGVEGELINHYIDNGAPEWDTHSARVRAKRFGSRVPEDRRERLRQARFLQYRGFTHDQIRRLIRIEDV